MIVSHDQRDLIPTFDPNVALMADTVVTNSPDLSSQGQTESQNVSARLAKSMITRRYGGKDLLQLGTIQFGCYVRFPGGLWTLLVLPYLPIGIALCLLRICMSLQAILLLLIFPEGAMKRYAAAEQFHVATRFNVQYE